MKRTFLTLLIALISFTVFSKDKVIVNPVYEFSKTGIEHVAKIELSENETRLHIHSIFLPNWWVKFPKTSYIEDCATGKRWQATGIINGEFDKEIFMPASGDSTFVLIFPPLDKTTTKINCCLNDESDIPVIFGISLDPKTKPISKEMPAGVSQWIDSELAKAKRKTLMDFEAGEFFEKDTARLIGYIKGYDLRAGFSTGMIYARNEITREDYPVVVQIHEDGRFEATIPMNFPKYSSVVFNRNSVNFYIQPGQTLAMLLDWEEFLMADRLRNILYSFKGVQYQGATAGINKELSTFEAQLPQLPYRKIYNEMKGKSPDEFKSFYNECISAYTKAYQKQLETEKLTEASKNILQNNYQMMYAMYLFEYAMDYAQSNQMPLEFYDFLQDIPMNNKELLSIQHFSVFINRLEYCQPLGNARQSVYKLLQPEKTYFQYLFEELNLQKTPEDEAFLLMGESFNEKVNSPDVEPEAREKFLGEYRAASEKFDEKYQQYADAYGKKYLDVIKRLTQAEIALKQWQLKDSIYTNELKLKSGIVYDVTKIRSLDQMFREVLDDNKEDAWNLLTELLFDIPELFLKKEADRLFQKNFPEESQNAYELPNTNEANIFKELIAPFKGKYLLVDFWATTCGPCVYNIKQTKTLREKYKDSKDVDFVFITSDSESPLSAYDKFVNEQELTNTYRLTADQYRYMRQLFRFNGIPRYVLVDREGKILDDDFSAHSFENWLREMSLDLF